MFQKKKTLKVLDFDIENRPLSYWADRPTAEVTAIASCWTDDIRTMQVHMLGRDDPAVMLQSFVERYNEADMVTGHYIRKHDLPQINGALLELGFPQLSPKMTCDTRLDMRVKGDIPATQEYLLELFGIPIQKYHMSQHKWRAGNRLTQEGIAGTETRVTSDVMGHILLRQYMVENNLLKAPRLWKS